MAENKTIKLDFANEDKTLDPGAWILKRESLKQVQDTLSEKTPYEADLETIEAILLIGAGESELLKIRMKEVADNH